MCQDDGQSTSLQVMQTKKLFDCHWPLASLFDSFVAMLQLAKTLTMLPYVTFFILFPCDLNFFSQFKYPPGYLSDHIRSIPMEMGLDERWHWMGSSFAMPCKMRSNDCNMKNRQ